MRDILYHRALVDAGIVAAGGSGSGMTPWRGSGLGVARRMVDTFVEEVGRVAPVARTEHPFLNRRDAYERVFPHYANIYRLRAAEESQPDWVLRADNLHLNVEWLRQNQHQGPVVATGGLLRQLRGSGSPLFRERYIWPAVQLNHLVPAGEGPAALESYRQVLERTFEAFGLPVLTLATDALSSYGDVCHLTVTCLRDGRPTVLATAYLMASPYRRALGVSGDLVDIGFTGKVLALVSMHHLDRGGLGLPSALAPVQVGVLAPQGAPGLDTWSRSLAGLRTRTVTVAGDVPFRRHRAERGLVRTGTPLTYGLWPDGTWRVGRRAPSRYAPTTPFPDADTVRAELGGYDRRQLDAARTRLRHSVERDGLVRGVCDGCAAAGRVPVFGRIVPHRPARCVHCAAPGSDHLVSEQGRFY
uniref:tRNA synthetase n=1 Tax=Streptomyces bottropensis TaxID=42235 RepID=A0A0K1H334_9ACTN|nr:tRNA synthetase [Streptomyces bottropensis]